MAVSDTVEAREEPARVLAAIEREAEAIKRRELDEAMAGLEARGEVTAADREAVLELADAIVETLIEPPAETVREAERNGDPAALEAVIDLFDPET